MSQFSLFDTEPTKQQPLSVGTKIRYRNGSRIISGKVLDSKDNICQVIAERDTPDGPYYGYSIQWINNFQIQ